LFFHNLILTSEQWVGCREAGENSGLFAVSAADIKYILYWKWSTGINNRFSAQSRDSRHISLYVSVPVV